MSNSPKSLLNEPLPRIDEIPDDVIKKWFSISEDENIDISLSRVDVDNLYTGYSAVVNAIISGQKALIQTDLAARNIGIRMSSENLIEGMNGVRRVVRRIMEGAIRKNEGV